MEDIYRKVESSKRGSFFIDNSEKKENSITPNHAEEGVAFFFSSKNTNSTKRKKALKEDGLLARKLIEDIL